MILKFLIYHRFTCIIFTCRGTYEIQPKAFIPEGAILGPKLRIHVQPDPTRPTEMKVDFERNASFVVGEKVPGNFSD